MASYGKFRAARWLPVVGYEGMYEVSDNGDVRNANSRKLKAQMEKSGGHLRVDLCRDGKQKCRPVHRLVLEAFVGPCPDGMECCHNDGNPKNNHVSNLRWDTYQSNRDDMVRHGRSTAGIKNPMSKLGDIDISLIRKWSLDGYRQREIAEAFGVCQSNISRIASGKTWSHV